MITTCILLTWSTMLSRQPSNVRQPQEAPLFLEPLSLTAAAVRGNWTATVAVVEFGDFLCTSCSEFARHTLPRIVSDYVETGQVLYAFKHYPLAAKNPFALTVAAGAVCADRQGRFWEMHDALFSDPQQLNDKTLRSLARAIGLQMGEFEECVRDDAPEAVRSDAAYVARLRLRGAPVFLIGPVNPDKTVNIQAVMSGARSRADFTRTIESQLTGANRLGTVNRRNGRDLAIAASIDWR